MKVMPGTDVKDAVVASYEALNENDIDAAMEALAEDAEWHESEVLPDTGVYRGREAIRAISPRRFPRLLGALPSDARGGGRGDRVWVMIHLEATGRGSTAATPATRRSLDRLGHTGNRGTTPSTTAPGPHSTP